MFQPREKTGQYDPGVLQAVAARFDIFVGHGSENGETKKIKFTDLQVGHVLARDLKTKEGTLLMTSGNKISPVLLQKLRNFAELSGIQEPISIQSH